MGISIWQNYTRTLLSHISRKSVCGGDEDFLDAKRQCVMNDEGNWVTDSRRGSRRPLKHSKLV